VTDDQATTAGGAEAGLVETLRAEDPDRFLSLGFAPARRRGSLAALYLVNHEIAKTGERVTEPMMGQIRLQWWREALERLYQGERAGHPAADLLAPLLGPEAEATRPPFALFDTLLEARENDLNSAPFDQVDPFTAYLDATSGGLMHIAAYLCAPDHAAGEACESAARTGGRAWGITGIIRALPFWAAQGRLMLPKSLCDEAGLDEKTLLTGERTAELDAVLKRLRTTARQELAAFKALKLPASVKGAFAYVPTAQIYLKETAKPGIDPFRTRIEPPAFRRQLSMLLG